MTASYEAARAAASNLIGGQPNEVVFTRGATEAINLVARSLPKEGRNRVLLSQLEHHSNIVPWQLAGYEVDAVPLTVDGRIDLDAAEAMITKEHRVVAFAHVSNVLGSILSTGSGPPRLRIRRARFCCSTAARPFREFRSTSRRSVANSMPTQGTSFTALPASAVSGVDTSCSTLFLRGREEAR
jgi:hypothetical protein